MRRRAPRVIRSETSVCIYCEVETRHDIIRIATASRPGLLGSKRQYFDVCRGCGGYRVVPY